jgi:putative ABC transport system substrate-binding protein
MRRLIDRRVFVMAMAGGLLATPFCARAQQAAARQRVGLLLTGSPTDKAQTRELDAFSKKLGALGWVDGQTITVKARWANSPDRLPTLAAELVGTGVDILVTPGPAATDAARHATSTIPIVMIAGTDPHLMGAAGLARPGGNLTGLTIGQPEAVHGKRLELLKEALPGVRRVAIVWDVAGYETGPGFSMLGAAAKVLGLELQHVDATGHGAYQGAFDAAARGGTGAVLLVESPRTVVQRAYIAHLALKRRLPVMSQFSRLVEAGGLMSYGPELSDLFTRAAVYVDKILRGARPGELPIEQPTKFELVINLKTAKALGLTIPPSLLARADQVIE